MYWDFSAWSEKCLKEPSRTFSIHANSWNSWTWPEKGEKSTSTAHGVWATVGAIPRLLQSFPYSWAVDVGWGLCVCSDQPSRALTLSRATLNSRVQKEFWFKEAVAFPPTSTFYLMQPAHTMPRKAAWPPLPTPFSPLEIFFGAQFFPGLAFAGLSLVTEAGAAQLYCTSL